MKRLLLIPALLLATTINVQAENHNGLGGLILGAGGGALVGQAVGRNTQATVVGTAVGSVIGYMIGSDMDRRDRNYSTVSHRPHYPAPRPVVKKYRQVTNHNYYYHPSEYRPAPKPRCKKAEILGTVRGKARKIYGTVCKTSNGWELVSRDYEPDYRNSRHDVRYNRHDRGHRRGWGERRF